MPLVRLGPSISNVLTILVSLVGLATPALALDPIARDIAAEVGLDYRGALVASTEGESPVFDYDGDGDLDILLSAHGGSPWPLMQNQGDNTFTEVLNGTFFKTDRHGCVAGDFGSLDGAGLPDGLSDLYCVTGACQGKCTKAYPNSLFLQRADRTFVDVAATWGVTDPRGRGRKPLTFDYDHDGLPDLFVANFGPSIYPTPNLLFRNLGGRFENVPNPAINTPRYSLCATSGDIDRDTWEDVLVCSMNPSNVGVATYKNNAGIFTDVTLSTKYSKYKAVDLELSDMNGDGRLDLIILEYKRLSVWLNNSGTFPKMHFSYALGEGHDIAVGDVNLDGRADIFITQGPHRLRQPVMLINNGTGKSYRTIPLPTVTEGSGDVVTAIPNWAGSGRPAFLVTNGRWAVKGPVQLIVFEEP